MTSTTPPEPGATRELPVPPVRIVSAAAPLSWIARGWRDFVRTPVPVSYTHLRAHETVLDLVCRLLLEKKNRHYTIDNTLRHHHNIQRYKQEQ